MYMVVEWRVEDAAVSNRLGDEEEGDMQTRYAVCGMQDRRGKRLGKKGQAQWLKSPRSTASSDRVPAGRGCRMERALRRHRIDRCPKRG
jgi:hypothetical protein